MKIQVSGLITESYDYDCLMVGGDYLADIVEDTDGCIAKLRYYISDVPIDPSKAVEQFLSDYYYGKSYVNGNYCAGSSWTGVYAKNDSFDIGGHDITKELLQHKGKYCYLIIETAD